MNYRKMQSALWREDVHGLVLLKRLYSCFVMGSAWETDSRRRRLAWCHGGRACLTRARLTSPLPWKHCGKYSGRLTATKGQHQRGKTNFVQDIFAGYLWLGAGPHRTDPAEDGQLSRDLCAVAGAAALVGSQGQNEQNGKAEQAEIPRGGHIEFSRGSCLWRSTASPCLPKAAWKQDCPKRTTQLDWLAGLKHCHIADNFSDNNIKVALPAGHCLPAANPPCSEQPRTTDTCAGLEQTMQFSCAQ
eukprot:6463437-Amphidinium_carterae.1